MHFRTKSKRLRDMSDKLARRMKEAIDYGSHWTKREEIPGIIVSGQTISVSCALNHHDTSTGVFRGTRLVPYEYPVHRGFVGKLVRSTRYDVVEFPEGVGRQYRMLRAAIYKVVGPGKTIVHADHHDGRVRVKGGPIFCLFLL